MTKQQKPPRGLRKQAAWLLSEAGWKQRQVTDRDRNLFAFNVKLYNLRLDFDHLLPMYAFSWDAAAKARDVQWARQARRKWNELYAEGTDVEPLYNLAVEQSRSDFVGEDLKPAAEEWTRNSDGQPISARFAFDGRQGGWLMPISLNCRATSEASIGSQLRAHANRYSQPTELSAKFVSDLTDLIARLTARLSNGGAVREVEQTAAAIFFGVLCADVPSEMLQLEVQKRRDAENRRFLDLIAGHRGPRLLGGGTSASASPLPLRGRRLIDRGALRVIDP